MPKRNTTNDAIDALNNADKLAAEKKAEALAIIPDPVFEGSIPFDSTFSDHEFNVRDAESYGFAANKTLYASLKEKGLEKRGDMLSFSVQADGKLKVLVGNLRHNMMSIIRRELIEEATKDGRGIPADQLPFASIFGLVYRNLTYGMETAIMADHIMRKSLNEFELAKEIGEFVERTGITIEKASVHFGMDKNKVRRLRMRYCMPTVFAEYRKEKAKGDAAGSYVKVGNEQLDALYTAYLSDRDLGCNHREEGAAFKRAWQIVISNPDAFKRKSQDTGPESKDRKKLIDSAQSLRANFGDSPEIEALEGALRWSGGDDVRLDVIASALKAYCDGLIAERDTFADAAAIAQIERDDLQRKLDSLTKDFEGLTVEHAELRAENDRLASEKTTTNGRRKAGR